MEPAHSLASETVMLLPVASPLAVRSKVTLSGLLPSALSLSFQALVTETETFSPSPVKTFTKLASAVWLVVARAPWNSS